MQDIAKSLFYMFENAGLDIVWENNIKKMVWKKLMLNVAGNSITALTLADYSFFKTSSKIQELCVQAMHEFLMVAQYENVELMKKDIDDVIDYYITYKGSNYKIPKDVVPTDLNYKTCLEIIKLQSEKAESAPKRGRYAKKK